MRTSHVLKTLALACALSSTLILGSCETIREGLGARTERIDVNAVACGAFHRITPSRRDTDETLRQIHEHNAAWEALCGERANG